MAENTFSDRIPDFEKPHEFLSPQLANLIQDDQYVKEDGIAYKAYKRINPIDISELAQGGKSINFLCTETTAFINPRRIFLDLDFVCYDDNSLTNGKPNGITNSKYVTCINPPGQGLIGISTEH